MPRNSKYPLQSLLQQRRMQVDSATTELGDAVRAREATEATAASAAEAERSAADADANVRGIEAQALAGGNLRAVDLARGSSWELGARQVLEDLARATDDAHQRTAAARLEEEEARSGVARSTADRDVIVQDQSRFDARARRAVESAEDEAAADIQRGGRGRVSAEGGRGPAADKS